MGAKIYCDRDHGRVLHNRQSSQSLDLPQSALQTPLRKLSFGNSSLQRVQQSITGFYRFFLLQKFISDSRLHIKDFKWGRKYMLMNCASCNGSPMKIPLLQLSFENEAKPHYCCKAFGAKPSNTAPVPIERRHSIKI